MVKTLKLIQLAIPIEAIVLFWLIYPGVMVIFASGVGVLYLLAAIGSFRNNRAAIWLAFVFSTLTAIFSSLGVNRFLLNGFDYFTGDFQPHSAFYFPPYLLMIISLCSILVVIMHLVSWRWMMRGV